MQGGSSIQSIDEIKNAILRKATGYEAEEVVEEYQMEDEVMTLTKRRVTKKHYPPDTQAAKLLIDIAEGVDANALTEEEIKEQIMRLIKEYEGEVNEENKTERTYSV